MTSTDNNVPRGGEKRYYFITGLPRSRTAWFANYLTWGDSVCYHDAYALCRTFSGFRDMLRDTPATHVGAADPAHALYWERLRDTFPTAKWIVIDRNFEDAYQASVAAFGLGTKRKALEVVQRRLHALTEALSPLVVNFEDINGLYATFVAQHLGIDIPHWRGDFLDRLQVQVEPRLLRSEIKRLREQGHPLLEEAA